MSKDGSESGAEPNPTSTRGRAAAEEIIKRFPAANDTDDSDGFRDDTIAMAQVFQAAGLNLAPRLAYVGRKELYDRWGYSSLKVYATNELRLTAKEFSDLMASYTFLETFEQKVLSKPTMPTGAPPPAVIALVAKASQRDDFDEEAYAKARPKLWNPDVSDREKLKLVKETFTPVPVERPKEVIFAGFAKESRRLAKGVAAEPALPKRARELSEELAEVLEAFAKKHPPGPPAP